MLVVTWNCHGRGETRPLAVNVLDTSAGSHIFQTFNAFRKQLFADSRLVVPEVPRAAACSAHAPPAQAPPIAGTRPGFGPGARVRETRLVLRRALPGAGTGLDGRGRAEARPGGCGATSGGTDASGSGAVERGRDARSVRPASPPLRTQAVPGGIPDRARTARVVSPTRPAARPEFLRFCNLCGRVGGLFFVEP